MKKKWEDMSGCTCALRGIEGIATVFEWNCNW